MVAITKVKSNTVWEWWNRVRHTFHQKLGVRDVDYDSLNLKEVDKVWHYWHTGFVKE